MAADQVPVNGSYGGAAAPSYTVDPASSAHGASDSISGQQEANGAAANGNIPKDEVGWYFVEQYYTTLSKTPEKLYLFYSKRSQFVSGSETETVRVAVGQKAIDERIKALDIQDCKVRVTNVDSQSSGQNIVIQVIGEMSNKTTPRTKFTQTFVLAEQTNGYFVLNDIFRYIVDDDDEPEAASTVPTTEPVQSEHATDEPLTLTNSQNPEERERDAQRVVQGLEQAINDPSATESAAAPAVNGSEPVELAAAEDAPAAATGVPAEAKDVTAAIDVPAEKPAAPQSTPAPVASPKPAAATAAPRPAVPKTWANLVATNANKAAAAAAAAQSATTSPPATAAAKAAAPAAAPVRPAAAAAPTQAPAAPASQDADQADTAQSSGSEWQSAQPHHNKKQQRPQSMVASGPNNRAYIKGVPATVDEQELKAELEKYGAIGPIEFNRAKNCAFVDFNEAAGYQAAAASNPHSLKGQNFFVEERRPRPQSFGGGFGGRGGMPGRGRGNMDRPAGQGRGGFQGKDGGAPRGGMQNRGRGGGGARGRGGVSQPA